MSSKTCKCGKGKVSQYDGKCGNCRTKAEQRLHEYKMREGLRQELINAGLLNERTKQ